jgi:hypothetical protein
MTVGVSMGREFDPEVSVARSFMTVAAPTVNTFESSLQQVLPSE